MRLLLPILFFVSFISCQEKTIPADLILYNGNIYTVEGDETGSVTAIAIRGDRIMALGSDEEMLALAGPESRLLDLDGQFTMPGFIEGHGHFAGMGSLLMNLNFLKAQSWDEVVDQVAAAAEKAAPGEWIIGRGWHQEKWAQQPNPQTFGYPHHDALSAVSPENPVMLIHASGHGLFANEVAMRMAEISSETSDPEGGAIIRDQQGNPIGMFEERAMKSIRGLYNDYLATLTEEEKLAQWHKQIELAQEECLRKGITSFQDAGSLFWEVEEYQKLAEAGELDLRMWVMIRQSAKEMADKLDPYPVIGAGNHFFTSRAIKSEVDGALGSFGAWLLSPYHDKPGFSGQNTTSISEVRAIATLAKEHGLQFCVHAIGDRANRVVLDIYQEMLESPEIGPQKRWRIEHAQHLDTADIPRFREYGIIASMQGIHCTSDAPFVVDRLGTERARLGAYPWRSLLDAGVIIANGTDAPVEDVNPIDCYYASVTRKRADTGMEFFPEQRMTREEALYSYTLGNAFAAFEENEKGSLKVGKLADIVVLSNNLLSCTDEEILETTVQMTIVGGVIKYEK
ncbi:MAG: amidohydrolase [Saprospiraceae bacterium]|nr:amidohydrolase [Saprospiraceae bacterium]